MSFAHFLLYFKLNSNKQVPQTLWEFEIPSFYCLYLQSEREFEHLVDDINAGRPQCPVGLMTLVLPRKGTLGVNDKQPFVYLKCGHVHGQHQWGQSHDSNDGRTCPLCLTVSCFKITH